jgi:hypothetical protein
MVFKSVEQMRIERYELLCSITSLLGRATAAASRDKLDDPNSDKEVHEKLPDIARISKVYTRYQDKSMSVTIMHHNRKRLLEKDTDYERFLRSPFYDPYHDHGGRVITPHPAAPSIGYVIGDS